MPLPPFVIIIGAFVLGAATRWATRPRPEGGVSPDNEEAEKSRDSAKKKHEDAKDQTEQARRTFMQRAGVYGDLQIEVARDTMGGFLSLLEDINRDGQSRDISVPDDLRIRLADPWEYQDIGRPNIFGTASPATVSLVGLFASVSTGTPAGLLRTRPATLDWLEGAPLAVGIAVGRGIVGSDSIVLGGIVVAPALIVDVYERGGSVRGYGVYEGRINNACEELKSLCDFLEEAKKRVDELENLLKGLSEQAQATMARIDPGDFSRADDLALFTEAFTLVNGVVDILKVPILDEEGNLSGESAEVLAKHRK